MTINHAYTGANSPALPDLPDGSTYLVFRLGNLSSSTTGQVQMVTDVVGSIVAALDDGKITANELSSLLQVVSRNSKNEVMGKLALMLPALLPNEGGKFNAGQAIRTALLLSLAW